MSKYKKIEQMEFVCYEMSVYPQHYLVYLNKPFFEQFKCGVEIYMNEEHMLEIIVRESGEGMIRQKYYSPNLVNRIVDVVKDRRTMHFAFFKDMKMGVWRGILLPKLQESFLWNNLHEAYIETTNLSDFQASRIVYMMKKKYYSFVTLEELKNYYFLGVWIAQNNYSYIDQEKYYIIYMCVSTLIKEYVRVQRHCKIYESKFSLNQTFHKESSCSLDMFLGKVDRSFIHIEIEEFIDGLSEIEKIVLRILSNDEDWKNKYLGTNMREIFLRTRESLRKKACEYYGNEIVKEYMIENV